MTLSARIDDDCKSLHRYFQRLFDLLQESVAEDKVAPIEVEDAAALESQKTYSRISHLIKPDMLINVYSLVDFWLKDICNYHRRRTKANLGYRDVRGNDDLHAFHKYLTKYIALNLASVHASYTRRQNLRDVRNHLIHHGGHVPDDERSLNRMSAIPGITLVRTLIVIDDSFVWDVLDCAKTYLCAAAQA